MLLVVTCPRGSGLRAFAAGVPGCTGGRSCGALQWSGELGFPTGAGLRRPASCLWFAVPCRQVDSLCTDVRMSYTRSVRV